MRNLIRRLFNLAGLDISRTDGRKPKWSGIAHDYYPINVQPRWGYGRKPHRQIEEVLTSRLDEFKALLIDCQRYKPHFDSIPYEQSSPNAPHWNNRWFSALDAAALMYFIVTRAPKTYLEVGGGMSTKFARLAITAGNLATKNLSQLTRDRGTRLIVSATPLFGFRLRIWISRNSTA
jgi:hypothetical protein